VLTAILTFIPYLGPVLAAVPAVLVGLADGFELALWIVALYTGIQVLENNLLTPFIQERTVSLPPVVLILAQILMGGLFGLLGILVATPLTVVAIVAVQTYYVRDVLGDSVKLMGERGEEPGGGRREPAPRQRVQHG
jgi:predicted PurR-regulated permease PerM